MGMSRLQVEKLWGDMENFEAVKVHRRMGQKICCPAAGSRHGAAASSVGSDRRRVAAGCDWCGRPLNPIGPWKFQQAPAALQAVSRAAGAAVAPFASRDDVLLVIAAQPFRQPKTSESRSVNIASQLREAHGVLEHAATDSPPDRRSLLPVGAPRSQKPVRFGVGAELG